MISQTLACFINHIGIMCGHGHGDAVKVSLSKLSSVVVVAELVKIVLKIFPFHFVVNAMKFFRTLYHCMICD